MRGLLSLRAPVGAPDAAEGQPDELGSDWIRQALQGVSAADCDQVAGEGGHGMGRGVSCQVASDDIRARRQRPAPGEKFPEIAVVGAPGVRCGSRLDEMQNACIGAGNANRRGCGGGCGERGWF